MSAGQRQENSIMYQAFLKMSERAKERATGGGREEGEKEREGKREKERKQ